MIRQGHLKLLIYEAAGYAIDDFIYEHPGTLDRKWRASVQKRVSQKIWHTVLNKLLDEYQLDQWLAAMEPNAEHLAWMARNAGKDRE